MTNSNVYRTYSRTVTHGHRDPKFAFIDGDNVWKTYENELSRNGIEKKANDYFDFYRLFRVLGHDRCYVYSAINDNTVQPKWLLDIEANDGFIVKMGELVEKPKTRKQEGVDVKLAIDATRLAYANIMRTCTLYGADGDFLPLVEAVAESGVVVEVVSFADPAQGRIAPKLRAAADNYIRMNPAWLYETLKPKYKTVNCSPHFFHDWRRTEDVHFFRARSKEFEIRRFESTYLVKVSDGGPSSMYSSPKLEDLKLWLSLMVFETV